MASHPNERPERPNIEEVPGMWPSTSANSFRQQYLAPGHLKGSHLHESAEQTSATDSQVNSNAPIAAEPTLVESTIPTAIDASAGANAVPAQSLHTPKSSDNEKTPPEDLASPESSPRPSKAMEKDIMPYSEKARRPSVDTATDDERVDSDEVGGYAPIKTSTTNKSNKRPGTASRVSTKRSVGLFKTISRKKTMDDADEQ